MAPTGWVRIRCPNCCVFGKVAGVEAARFAKAVAPGNSASLLKQAQAVEQRVLGLKTKTGGSERIATLRKEMAQTMEDGCGIYRLAETMQQTCDKLDELKERFKNVNVEDKSSVWNTEWLLAIELEYQLDVAQTMAYSALIGASRAVRISASTVSSSATMSTS
jgi:fumarate reductase flavoprotein subunit